MGVGGTAVVGQRDGALGHAAPREARAAELAWLAAVPCAALVVILIAVLGPPLGRLLFPPTHVVFWPQVLETAIPPNREPTEHARYLLALSAPLLLAGAIVLAPRFAPRWPAELTAWVVRGVQLAALAFVAVCVVEQRRQTYFEGVNASPHVVYFTLPTLAVAAALTAASAAALRSGRAWRALRALAVETRARRLAASAGAAVAVGVWLLPAINTERTIVAAHVVVAEHLPFWLDEVFAVLDGRYPLVDFAAQYGSLWPYPIGGAMALFGTSIGVYTVATVAIGAVALLALFGVFRRVAGSVLGLLVFLPVLATTLFMMEGPLANRYAVVNLFSTFPLRYAGPLLLAWITARHLAGAPPRRARWLFLAGGLVALNNAEFGVPALAATAAAVAWSSERLTRARLRTLALEAALGVAAALALLSALTLIAAGSLPHLSLLFRYTHLFALAGYGMLPMKPLVGMSTILYLTYVAAIGVATVRAVSRDPDRLMTGLLAWSGVFGLGIGSYYMGRSYPEVLINLFGAWALSVALLLVVVVRAMAARAPRLPTLAEAACLFAFALMICSLAQTPTPWSQASRLRHTGVAVYARPMGQPFVAAHTRSGESVALLTQLGHRAAYNLGIADVTPYTGGSSMPTADQLDETLRLLREAGGRKVFLSLEERFADMPRALLERGYRRVAVERFGMQEFVAPARPARAGTAHDG
jgi:hypothetical protein